MLRKKAVVIDRYNYLRKLANIKNCGGCMHKGNGCGNLKYDPFAGKEIRRDLKYYYFNSYAPEEIHYG